jgi:hypothetical protein
VCPVSRKLANLIHLDERLGGREFGRQEPETSRESVHARTRRHARPRDARVRDCEQLPAALLADRLPSAVVPGGTVAQASPHGRHHLRPHDVAATRLGGPPRMHRSRSRLRQPALGRASGSCADRRHRLFYQRLLTELAVGDAPLRTMRTFDPSRATSRSRPDGAAPLSSYYVHQAPNPAAWVRVRGRTILLMHCIELARTPLGVIIIIYHLFKCGRGWSLTRF